MKAPPEHGTRARYLRGCHCRPCTSAQAAYGRARSRQVAYGRWEPYTDATAARAHLTALAAAGITWQHAAALAGIQKSPVRALLFGAAPGRPPSRRVRHSTETAILAVPVRPPVPLPGRVLTGATGTQRRLQALIAAGWPPAYLADALGADRNNFYRLLTRDQVRAATARAVRELYDDLWDTPPPAGPYKSAASARARDTAASRGWPPPAAWDDDTIDNPAARPAPGWQRSRLTSADLADEARDLLGQGLTRDLAAQRLGRTRYAVDKALARHPNPPGRQARKGAA